MIDFSRIFAPARPPRDQASPDTIHRTDRASAEVHDFWHLDAVERESAAAGTQRAQHDEHGNARAAQKGNE